MKRIGEKLHTLRTHYGYTSQQLADRLDVSASFVIQVEKGNKKPSTDLMLKIAELFEVSLDKLMRDNEEL